MPPWNIRRGSASQGPRCLSQELRHQRKPKFPKEIKGFRSGLAVACGCSGSAPVSPLQALISRARAFWHYLGTVWDHLGSSWLHLGLISGHFSSVLGHLGFSLGPKKSRGRPKAPWWRRGNILDPGSWITVLGSRILDPGSCNQDPGSRILDQHPGSRIRNAGSWILDPGS